MEPITFQSHPVLWTLAVVLMLGVLGVWALVGLLAVRHAPLTEDDGTPEKPWLPEDFKPAKPIRRKRAPHTPDRIIQGIHEREQAHHG